MQLVNNTEWRTDDLRKVFNKVCKKTGYTPYKIVVVYSKGFGNVNGRGGIGYGWVKMMIPGKVTGVKGKATVLEGSIITMIAQVLVHELGHNMSLAHKDMRPWWTIDVSCVNGMKIRRRADAIPKPATDVVMKRHATAAKHVAEWEAKLAMLDRQRASVSARLEKWMRAKTRYERDYPSRVAGTMSRA